MPERYTYLVRVTVYAEDGQPRPTNKVIEQAVEIAVSETVGGNNSVNAESEKVDA